MEHLGTHDITLFIAIIIVFLLFALLAYCVNTIVPFMKARKYIKMEMKRSSGKEYEYWKSDLKKLYLNSIPLIGRFFR